jgi:hypothetical protein
LQYVVFVNRSRHTAAPAGAGRSWWRWVKRGALSGAVLAGLPAGATQAQTPNRARYESELSFGVSLVGALAPTFKVGYGLDLRFGTGPTVGFLRVEGRSIGHVRLVSGIQRLSESSLFGEIGLAFHSRHRGGLLGPGVGAHLGAGVWRQPFAFTLAGTPILIGDRRNYDVALMATAVAGISGQTNEVPGRPLRAGELLLLPEVFGWMWNPAGDEVDDPRAAERAAIAAERLEGARMEHASIHAFVRMAAELAAVGAPAALVEQARAAAEEEAEHTVICLALAGVPAQLQPLPPEAGRPRFARSSREALACLGREAWVDGCLGEGTAAARATLASAGARQPAVAQAERLIARDEGGHAELSWRVLEWVWREGHPAVRDAIAAAIEEARPAAAAPTARDLDEEFLATQGLLPAHLQERAADQVLDRAQARLRHLGLPV